MREGTGAVSAKILVVDDERTLLHFMQQYLEEEGYEVVTVDSGPKAVRSFYQERPDLVLLDVMMPGMDGWEVCARLREMADTPIVLLTAKDSEGDKLRGFRLGVDDYVTKPFSFAELAARIKAVLGRAAAEAEPPKKVRGESLCVDFKRREVQVDGRIVDLTPNEFRLLAALSRRLGEAVAHQELVREVWGDLREVSPSALRRYIWFLRQKIEPDPSSPQRLLTVRGYGYRLEG
jgi:DNA-binding response OmpR family regulator